MEYLVNGNIDLRGCHWGSDYQRHLMANGVYGATSEYHRHLIANGLAPANPGLPDRPEFHRFKGFMKRR